MPARKRARAELEDEDDTPAPAVQPPSTLQRIRNMWEFASLMQYLFLFAKAIKADEWEIEDFEDELLKPEHSPRLSELALTMLKVFSSFRPLNLDTLEEDIRRRYDRKGTQNNPFGYDEQPNKLASLDVFTKIRVLQQLSVWTFNNPDRIREKMGERESEQLLWRMEPLGWDEDERSYFVFDDDRLYRRTDAPLPPEPEPKTKPKGRNAKKTRSAKKRRKSRPVIESSPDVDEEEESTMNGVEAEAAEQEDEDDGFGGMKWELVAITLDEYNTFLDTIRRSRDANAKVLFKQITNTVLPTIEKRAEQLRQKEQRKLKELANLQKMATAKRSSRLAGKAEQKKAQAEAEAAEVKQREDLDMAHRELARQRKLEEDRESRMITREQRLKEREVKRILHEEELKKLEEEKERAGSDQARISERHLKSEMEKQKKELERIAQEEDWTFDCAKCGLHGQNVDDGSHSIACDKCGVWQHSACHGIQQSDAERDDFQFKCSSCRRKEELKNQPTIPPLKFRFSASPKVEQRQVDVVPKPGPAQPTQGTMPPMSRFDGVDMHDRPTSNGSAAPNGSSGSPTQRPSSSHTNPMASAPQLPREAASPAATASFRYSLQRGDAPAQPQQVVYSPPPQQSWNHYYTQPYANGAYHQPQGSPQAPTKLSTVAPAGKSQSPSMGTFGVLKPPSSRTTQGPASPQHARSSSGHSGSIPPPFAPHAQSSSPTQTNGAQGRPQPLSGHGPPASPTRARNDVYSTPVAPQNQVIYAARDPATGQQTSPPPAAYLSTPQYAPPPPFPVYTPSAAGMSPHKQESPYLAPGFALSGSPPVVPPATTLTPTYGNVQHNSPPVKKAASPTQIHG